MTPSEMRPEYEFDYSKAIRGKYQRQIHARVTLEVSEDAALHIIYTPDQTQLLEAGQEYEFIFNFEEPARSAPVPRTKKSTTAAAKPVPAKKPQNKRKRPQNQENKEENP